MPQSGYTRGKPEPAWWMEQIKAGEEFRKKHADQSKWDTWQEYYRGNWDRDVMPVNLFFTMARSTVPRIYFRDPSVSIQAAKPGLLNLSFARVLERLDNKLIRQMKLKKQMKRVTQDTFMKGTGVLKLGFGGFYGPGVDDEWPFDESGNRVEYNSYVQPDMPWITRLNPGNFVVPSGLCDYEHGRWVAEKIERDVEDVRADPRLENTRGLKPTKKLDTKYGTIHGSQDLVELYEIHDRKTGRVMVIAPHGEEGGKVLYFERDTFQLYGGFPYFPTIFNDDGEVFWGVSDSKILEPYQREINETRTLIMKHRRLTLVKILVKEGSMDTEQAERLVSEDVGAVAWVKGSSISDAVSVMQQSTIPQELFLNAEATMQDVRETLGFSRNQFGEFNSRSGDTSATEASIVKQATEIRVDERRDMLADTLTEIIGQMHGILFDQWQPITAIDVLGPGGAKIWVNFSSELMRQGRYDVRIDPDANIPETRQLREQRAVQLYQLLKTNPLVDPVKLTQYLMHELKGVQFDDMMKMLPPAEGGTPERPINPEDFAQMIGNSLGQVGRPGGMQQPRVAAPGQTTGIDNP